ncbi:MAG: SLBB domain-containing protein [Sphaerochaetaceae bacterium]
MKRYMSCILVVMCVLTLGLSAASSSVIIQSPLYSRADDVETSLSADNSFVGQLGLSGVASNTIDEVEVSERVIRAMSQPDYPMTPGDQLQLTYTDANQMKSAVVQVSSSYKISLPQFGSVDVNGINFEQCRTAIEDLVKTYLPFSNPQVSLIHVGSFYVTVKGEVTRTVQVPCWGLSRLSEVLSYASDYASTRRVLVTGYHGETNEYDPYAALREGDLSQNPFLKAGDVITLFPSDTTVTVLGEVRRPGTYQIEEEQTLSEVVARYGKGLLPSGDSRNFTVRRYNEDQKIEVLSVPDTQVDSFILEDFDTVFVNSFIPATKAVSIEGAVSFEDETTTDMISSSRKVYYQFYPGESVQKMLQNISSRFTSVSDLANMYLKRGDTIIPIDAESLLLGENVEDTSLTLQEGDSFIVPFSQLFVHVAGGVLNPGTYPYIPDKNAQYYLNLAGGFDPGKNRNGSFSVLDKDGNRLDTDSVIPPESIVTAKLNTFQAVNGLNLATTVTITSLVATIVAIIVDIASLSD